MDGCTAREAYEDLAPAYDLLTADYPHDRWLEALLSLARSHGLRGREVLDVACGTGKSFLPLLARGFDVVGCDISPAMLARAAAKAPAARLVQADMRSLGALGEFDLVTCLDDALNYLLGPGDLAAAFAGIRRNLRPRGIAIWDVNTLALYRSAFASDRTTDRDGVFLAWRGETPVALEAGARPRARPPRRAAHPRRARPAPRRRPRTGARRARPQQGGLPRVPGRPPRFSDRGREEVTRMSIGSI
jgi:SAM-dependent methyltransferase